MFFDWWLTSPPRKRLKANLLTQKSITLRKDQLKCQKDDASDHIMTFTLFIKTGLHYTKTCK